MLRNEPAIYLTLNISRVIWQPGESMAIAGPAQMERLDILSNHIVDRADL